MRRAAKVDANQAEIVADRDYSAAVLSLDYLAGIPRKDSAQHLGITRSQATVLSQEYGIPAIKRGVRKACPECGSVFQTSPSTNKKYCSYQCHLDSGGAKRAGEAAAMARLKYGAKKDANHNEVFDVIRSITAVHDLSAAGCGVPDGLAWVLGGWQLFDVKNPETGYGRRGLNERQKKWADDWRGGPVFLIYDALEAERFARGNFEGLKRFPELENVGV